MNTRLLRMTRFWHGFSCRVFRGLGQLQPVTISRTHFRCEGVRNGEACLTEYRLPQQRQEVRQRLAYLIECRERGARTDAWEAFALYTDSKWRKPRKPRKR